MFNPLSQQTAKMCEPCSVFILWHSAENKVSQKVHSLSMQRDPASQLGHLPDCSFQQGLVLPALLWKCLF